jgi:hypothetical protein
MAGFALIQQPGIGAVDGAADMPIQPSLMADPSHIAICRVVIGPAFPIPAGPEWGGKALRATGDWRGYSPSFAIQPSPASVPARGLYSAPICPPQPIASMAGSSQA